MDWTDEQKINLLRGVFEQAIAHGINVYQDDEFIRAAIEFARVHNIPLDHKTLSETVGDCDPTDISDYLSGLTQLFSEPTDAVTLTTPSADNPPTASSKKRPASGSESPTPVKKAKVDPIIRDLRDLGERVQKAEMQPTAETAREKTEAQDGATELGLFDSEESCKECGYD
ncbi:hypothetical protein BJX99DRAFT_257451 [Aspergillus californicus]